MPAKPSLWGHPTRLAAWALTAALLLSLQPNGVVADTPGPTASATPSATRDALAPALDRLTDAVRRAGAVVGVAVVDLDSGALVVGHRERTPHNPASNMKLFTAWAALVELGPDHRFLTALLGRQKGDRVETVWLRGDGDPSLEVRHLQEMVARLHRAGVREIGDIVVDQSHFDGTYVPPAFGQQPHEWAAFRAPVAAVSLAGNTVMMEVRPTRRGEPAVVTFVPPSFVTTTGRVSTSGPDEPEAVQLTLSPQGAGLSAALGGTLPEGSPTLRVWRRVDDPTLLAGYALADVCREQGITVSGSVKPGSAPTSTPLLGAHRSEPLARLLWALGKHSNNFYAEMIFKSLSVKKGGPPASFERSARRVETLLDDAGFDRHGLRFRNGSGLFDAGQLTPLATAKLLAAAHRDPRVGPELQAQLSIGGVDGTLRRRFRRWKAQRIIRGKTGTLAAVSALSGYVHRPGGRGGVAFSVMVNEARGRSIRLRQDIDRFVDAVAEQMTR